jgi:hypothetical protein
MTRSRLVLAALVLGPIVAGGCIPSPTERYTSNMTRFAHQAREAQARWEKDDMSVPDIEKYAKVLRLYLLVPPDRTDPDSQALYQKALALTHAHEALTKHIQDRQTAVEAWTKLRLARGLDDPEVKAAETKLEELGRQGPALAQSVRQHGQEFLAAYDDLLKRMPPR